MTGGVPARARRIAGELVVAFAEDQQLARRLNAAHERLQQANSQLWSGLHPDALGLLNDDTDHTAISEGSSVIVGLASDAIRFEHSVQETEAVLLPKLQEIHWTIHRAQADYQTTAEQRRQLAADVGELIARLVDALIGAGWSEPDARNADVHELAGEREASG